MSAGPREVPLQQRWEPCNAGIIAADGHVDEFTGCAAEDIPNCWNCAYPLTDHGYFGGLEWDREDPRNAVLHSALTRLKELHPLPAFTFGVPVHRTGAGEIECEGSTCSIACLKRVVEDGHAYNVSEQDALMTSMAMKFGIPLERLHTALPRFTLKLWGGVFSHAEYSDKSVTCDAVATSSELLLRRATVVQVQNKAPQRGALVVAKSLYEGFIRGTTTAEPVYLYASDVAPSSTAPVSAPASAPASASASTSGHVPNAAADAALERGAGQATGPRSAVDLGACTSAGTAATAAAAAAADSRAGLGSDPAGVLAGGAAASLGAASTGTDSGVGVGAGNCSAADTGGCAGARAGPGIEAAGITVTEATYSTNRLELQKQKDRTGTRAADSAMRPAGSVGPAPPSAGARKAALGTAGARKSHGAGAGEAPSDGPGHAAAHASGAQGAGLQGAEVHGAEVHGAEVHGAEVQGSGAQGAEVHGAEVQGAGVQGAVGHGVEVHGAEVQGAGLQGAEGHGVEGHGAGVQGAEGQSAGVQGAKVQGAKVQGAHAKNTRTGGARKRRAAAVASGRSSPPRAQDRDTTSTPSLADATASVPQRADSTPDTPSCTGGDAGTVCGGECMGGDGARAAVGRLDSHGEPGCPVTGNNKPPRALNQPNSGHNGAGSKGRAAQPRSGNSLAALFRRVQ
jgi:hypothetical protein